MDSNLCDTMNKTLSKELLELSKKVDNILDLNIQAKIIPTVELSDDISLPFTFTCEALHPGEYKGFVLDEEDIILGKDTIFDVEDEFDNSEINKDHKSARKVGESSVDDVIGKVVANSYEMETKSYNLTGHIYDESIARKIMNGLIKYVSLAIKPGRIINANGKRYAKNLVFQELSLVRAPGDPNARIINHEGN